MSLAAGLALYSLAVMAIGPGALQRLTAGGHAPRFAITAWLTAITSMLLCWPAVLALVVVELAGHTVGGDAMWASCVDTLREILLGHAGPGPQVITTLVVTVFIGALCVTALRVVRSLGRMRGKAHEHARAVRIVGRSVGGEVVVVEAVEPAAYCVAGRPSAIVVTTAALDTLDPSELAAVLAHERAHLAGRHAHLMALLRSLAAALPAVALITRGVAQVATLLEMCADDAAARRHGSTPLLGGLLALSGTAPSAVLAAANVAVLARAERLFDAAPARRRMLARAQLGAAMTVIAAGPVGSATLAITGMLLCTP